MLFNLIQEYNNNKNEVKRSREKERESEKKKKRRPIKKGLFQLRFSKNEKILQMLMIMDYLLKMKKMKN